MKKKNTSAFLSNQKTQMMSDSYELSVDSLNSKFQSTSKKPQGNIYSVGRMFSKFISPESHSPSDPRTLTQNFVNSRKSTRTSNISNPSKRSSKTSLASKKASKKSKQYLKVVENKENERPSNRIKTGEIIIVPEKSKRKALAQLPEETAQMISVNSSTSEKSVSEGFTTKHIPDS